MEQKRRDFLKFMGYSSVALGMGPTILNLGGCTHSNRLNNQRPFLPLQPTKVDDLVLAKGFSYEVLIQAETPINSKDVFGQHNDYLAFIPFPDRQDAGLLWVNHEYLHPVLVHNRAMNRPRTRQEILKEQASVGGSILEMKKENYRWQVVKNSTYNRRISALTNIPFQKDYQILGKSVAKGTLANCAGGITPWGTILTCEENYDIFYGETAYNNGKRTFIPHDDELAWYKYDAQPPEHYGWVVEVDLKTGKAIKRNALGRAPHEGATVALSSSGFPVVYMGEDRVGGFVYKFVSSQKNSLEAGTLYAADTNNGRWLPLDIQKNKQLAKSFKNQVDVLTYSHQAAKIAGATPQDRPEDIEIHPNTGDIYIAMTKNPATENFNGSILRIQENNKAYEGLNFKASVWLSGGIENGFACPDNMVFDNKGNLWLTVDMSEKDIKKGHYKGLGNNGLYYIPMSGSNAGEVFQVASAPVDAEFTGPFFAPDYKTLFLSVQHPGSSTKDPKNPSSTWPNRKGLPKSSVVTISGPALNALTS